MWKAFPSKVTLYYFQGQIVHYDYNVNIEDAIQIDSKPIYSQLGLVGVALYVIIEIDDMLIFVREREREKGSNGTINKHKSSSKKGKTMPDKYKKSVLEINHRCARKRVHKCIVGKILQP